jgi:hypothetical protein
MRTRFAAATILVAAAVLVPSASAIASTDDFTFASFDADYYLARDDSHNATLRVVETLVARFPDSDQNHGIERTIPNRDGDIDFDVSIRSVTDGAGKDVPYTTTSDDVYGKSLRIGDGAAFVHGERTYRIEYTMRNVIRSFADTRADEFYWDVNGTGWRQTFDTVSARVHLGAGLTAALTGKSSCYSGEQGGTGRCAIDRHGSTFTSRAAGFGSFETMTVAIGFAPSTFAEAQRRGDHWAFTVLPWVLVGLLLAIALFAAYLRLVVWRDHPGRGIIVAQYAPEKNMHPHARGRTPQAPHDRTARSNREFRREGDRANPGVPGQTEEPASPARTSHRQPQGGADGRAQDPRDALRCPQRSSGDPARPYGPCARRPGCQPPVR